MEKGEHMANLYWKLWSPLTQLLPSLNTLDLFNEISACKVMQSDAGGLIFVWRQRFGHLGDNRRIWGVSSRHVGRNVFGGKGVQSQVIRG